MKCDDCCCFMKVEEVTPGSCGSLVVTLFCRSLNREVVNVISCTQYFKVGS